MFAFQSTLLLFNFSAVEDENVTNLFTTIVDLVNSNSGAITALSTIAYTIFTLILVRQNRKAINKSRLQFTETQRQFVEMNRCRVFPSLAKVADNGGDLLCLKFENPTNTPAEKIKISINNEWLSQYDKISHCDMKKTKSDLEAINSASFFTIMPKQALFYTLCVVPGLVYTELSEVTLEVSITYSTGNLSAEKFFFDLKAIGTQLAQSSDYVRLERDHLKKLEKIHTAIEKLRV